MALLNWSHREAALTGSETRFQHKATADECREIAAALDILACDFIEADYKIIPLPQGRYRVRGEFHSSVEQACVVSLEPVYSKLYETFDIEFWPASQLPDLGEIELSDPDAEDPEPFTAGCLEVGHLIYELLASRIEQYPRKQGKNFNIAETKRQPFTPADTPFAELGLLKNKLQNKPDDDMS